MNHIIAENLTRNGNGADSVNGRGILRRKMTPEQRVSLAADIAVGLTPFALSLKQTAAVTGVPVAKLRAELKARTAQQDYNQWLDELDRQDVEKLQAQTEAETINDQADAIVTAWFAAHPYANEVAIRLLGPAAVWDVLARVVA
jgi:hypothetical protein